MASQETVKITAKEWRDKARVFGANFTKLYTKEAVTPYLHCFIYHVGFYLEEYGALDIFGNYGTEGRIRSNKRMISRSTNGFSSIKAVRNITYQQLKRSWSEDVHRIEEKERTTQPPTTDTTEPTTTTTEPTTNNTTTPAPSKKRKRDEDYNDAWAKRELKKRDKIPEFTHIDLPAIVEPVDSDEEEAMAAEEIRRVQLKFKMIVLLLIT